MANETIITIIGNLTGDPEVRYTASGAPVANFNVASTPRIYDRNSGQWKDGDTLFMRCSVWQQAAENVAESLRKGMRVVVYGRLVQRRFKTQDGQDRIVVEMQVEEVGPALRYATAQVTRNPQQGQQGGQQAFSGANSPQPTQGYGQGMNAPQNANAGASDPWGAGVNNEPPF